MSQLFNAPIHIGEFNFKLCSFGSQYSQLLIDLFLCNHSLVSIGE